MVAVVAPEGSARVADHWAVNDLPFVGLADPDHQVARLYDQPFRLLKLGRLPSVTVVDRGGRLQFLHLGRSMRDIPTNQEILKVLEELQTSSEDSPTDLGT